MLVIDASVAVKFVVEEPDSDAAVALLSGPEMLVAPDWVIAEVANALRRKVGEEALTGEDAIAAVAILPRFFQALHPSERLVDAAMRLAIELDHAFYDCLYLALAVDLGATLVTADRKFVASAAPRAYPVIALRMP